MASATANSENGEINSKIKRIPRKKFPWSEDARKALLDIIQIKKKCYALEGSRKETFEENLETFLKSAVLSLWPEGWMTKHTLLKQAKFILESGSTKAPPPNVPKPVVIPSMSPISLDIHATAITAAPSGSFAHSPVKTVSPSGPTSVAGITVIPISQASMTSPKAAAQNGPKMKASPPIVMKPSTNDLSVTVNLKSDSVNNSPINMSAEICAVTPKENNSSPGMSSLLMPSKSSVTITSVDLRTNSAAKSEECTTENTPLPKPSSIPPQNLKQRILSDIPANPKPRTENNECQIIDLTDTPVVIRKPGPKSKTRYMEVVPKMKRVKEATKEDSSSVIHRKPEEITGTQAFNQIITGLTKYGANAVELSAPKGGYKENQAAVNEDDMEQVMKDLKELQQLQEHARKNEIDIMAPSSSPVSVIAFNSNYSQNKLQASDLSAGKDRKTQAHGDNAGFQDIFQKHLFQDVPLLKPAQSSSNVYNSNVQPKNNYNRCS